MHKIICMLKRSQMVKIKDILCKYKKCKRYRQLHHRVGYKIQEQ